MADELATAYVSIVPSFQGASKALADELGPASEDVGKDAGGRAGGAFSSAFSGFIGAAALFGGGALLASAWDLALAEADLPGSLRAQFGLTEAAAAESAQIAADVYAQGWGGSLDEVGTAVGEVGRQLEQLGDTGDVEALAISAQGLAQVFEEDVAGVIRAAGQLVKTGLAPDMESALDVIAVGFQSGADSADDLLDTLNEYSVLLAGLGLDGATSIGLINQGLAEGARNGDLVADALKEFQIRATDGSAAEAFESIGLSADEMTAAITEGGPAAAAALDTTLDTLRGIEDPAARNAAAFQIFGTQAEDLGSALFALDPSSAAEGLGEVAGAANEVTDGASGTRTQIDTLGRAFQDSLASALVTIAPLLEGLLTVITPLAPILGPLAIAIGVITIAQWLWNAALLASPVTWIILGIVALIAAIVLLIAHWDTVVKALEVAWNWIKDTAATVWNAIADFFIQWWPWIFAIMTGGLTLIVDFIIDHWDEIKAITSDVWNSIKDFFQGIWDWMVQFTIDQVQNVLDTIAWFKELGSLVGGWFSDMYDSATEKLSDLVGWVKDLPDMILDALGDLGSLLLDAGKDILRGLIDGIESMWNSVQSKFTELTNSIPDWKGPESRDKRLLYDEGGWIIGSLEEGMDDKIPAIESTLADLTADIGMAVRPPSTVLNAGAGQSDPYSAQPLIVQGPLIAVDSLTVDSDERVGELAQELWARASRADRARGQVLLEGATR